MSDPRTDAAREAAAQMLDAAQKRDLTSAVKTITDLAAKDLKAAELALDTLIILGASKQ